MKVSFEKTYPNIARWVDEHKGWVEIGYDVDSPITSFIRALDCGGMPWVGKDSYNSLGEALQDLDAGLEAVPKSVTNLAWGDKDYKTLYITAGQSVYQIRLNIAGIVPGKTVISQRKNEFSF